MRKISFLEWVRGTAALIVAVHHTLFDQWPAYEHFSATYVDFGRLGVVAFFLVSGYIIPISFQRQTIRTFVVRRAFRLYPIYLVALGVYAVFLVEQADWSSPWWWAQVAINATMLHELIGLKSILGPAWTLSIEWVFYGQKVLAKRFGVFTRDWLAAYLWLGLYALMGGVERLTGRDLPTTLPMLLAVACVGNALHLTQEGVVSRRAFTAVLASLLIVVPVGSVVGIDLWAPLTYSLSFLGGLLWFAVAFAFRDREGPRVLLWLGAVSYSVYLLAPVGGEAVVAVLGGPAWLVVPVSLAAILLLAWAGHRWIELPGIAYGRRLTGSRKGAAKVAPVSAREEAPLPAEAERGAR